MTVLFWLVLPSLYFALPMYLANIAPVLTARLPFLDVRLDFGKTWRGQPIFGSHKTWRGLLSGTIFGIVTVCVQAWLAWQFPSMHAFGLIDYQQVHPVLLGLLLGAGAMAGDAIKSMVKRQVGIAPGQPWVPFDQVDFVLGGLILTSLYVWPGTIPACIILLFTPLLHIITNVIAFKLGMKSVPW